MARSDRFIPAANEHLKYEANLEFLRALHAGEICRPDTCQICGSEGSSTGSKAVSGHHTDYARPLDVQWLCVRCHKRAHHTAAPDEVRTQIQVNKEVWSELRWISIGLDRTLKSLIHEALTEFVEHHKQDGREGIVSEELIRGNHDNQ